MIRAILIDIDDTLLDFEAHIKNCIQTGFETYSLGEYSDEIVQVFHRINSSLWHQLERNEISFEDIKRTRWAKVFQALNIDFDGREFEEYFRSQLFYSAVLVEGAMENVKKLHSRFPLYTASNGPNLQQRNRIKLSGLEPYFTDHFISEQIGHSKPCKGFFEYCLKTIRAELPEILPEEILMIGDSLTSDMKGARDFGMKCCFFDKKMFGNQNPKSYDYYVSHWDEVLDIL